MPQHDVDNGVDEMFGKFEDAAEAAELLASICRKVTRKTIVDSTIAADAVVGKELLGRMIQSTHRLLDESAMLCLLTALASTNFLHDETPNGEDNLTPAQRAKLESMGKAQSKYNI